MLPDKVIRQFLVKPGKKIKLKSFPTDWTTEKELRKFSEEEIKKRSEAILAKSTENLAEAQELLWANDVYSVLIVLQAMDAAGKDGLIKHVMSGINPQGCQVFSFKQPSAEELDHNFLWRYMRALPERGRIGIFNRSYYEEVLVVKVHPQIIEKQKLPPGKRGKQFWADRYDDINNFEKHLVRNGTVVLKFFLNVSKKEQKKRFLERLDRPEKNWKFSPSDVAERGFWDDYMQAFEDALRATSTDWAPWYVIPADRKYVARALVANIIADSMKGLGLKPPKVDPAARKNLEAVRKQLMAE